MNVRQWLERTINHFDAIKTPTAQLDAEVLLADVLEVDRSWLHAHPDHVLQRSDLRKLEAMVRRRVEHEPIAYIRGKQEFYGRDFFVSPDTLTPRPETEELVQQALTILQDNPDIETITDVGTGSGCIAITLALEAKRNVNIHAVDISEKALTIAQQNCTRHKVPVELVHDDLITSPTPSWLDSQLIVANLPYVPENFSINLSATHEPPQSIFGGADGLDLYRVLFKKLGTTCLYVITESLPPQNETLATIAQENKFKLVNTQDLIQVFKRL